MKIIPKKSQKIFLSIVFVGWVFLHIPGILYGTKDVPLHISYIGDEQAPINGALHILQEKSLLGLRNVSTVYYGPVFSIIALPAVLLDFSQQFLVGNIHSTEEYKTHILFDWGGIIVYARILSLLASLLGLFFVYKIMSTKTMNPTESKVIPMVTVFLLGFNYYYFEYSHFFKHWAFITPLLLIQFFTAIRIYETSFVEEKKTPMSFWVAHGIVSVLAFGISYVSLIFFVMWIPIIVKVIQKKNTSFLISFLYNTLWIISGAGIIVLWHPYAFLRILSFLGVGISRGGLGNTQNPFSLGANSFSYYIHEVLWNHLFLLGALVVVLWTNYQKKFRSICSLPTLMCLSVSVTNFFFFALAEHHEGRYMLLTIIFLIIFVAYMGSEYFTFFDLKRDIKLSKTTVFIGVLLFTYVLLQAISIGGWIRIYAAGPVEQKVIEKLLQVQNPKEKTLVVNSYILGYPHTTLAYMDYMKNTNKENVNLYKEILKASIPKGVTPLDVYYASLAEFYSNKKMRTSFSHIILKDEPREELNQFDFFDENIFRIWKYDDYSPHYFFLK